MKEHRPTEAQCQTTIINAATLAGWWVHAQRPGQFKDGRYASQIQGHQGWPDLVLLRADRFLVVELKRKPNKVEPEQHTWINKLIYAGIDARVVWVPEGMQEFIDELTRRP